MTDSHDEQYPGQHTTPKNGCPVCGGPIDVAQVDTGTKPYHDFIPGRWSCPRGCDPRTQTTPVEATAICCGGDHCAGLCGRVLTADEIAERTTP